MSACSKILLFLPSSASSMTQSDSIEVADQRTTTHRAEWSSSAILVRKRSPATRDTSHQTVQPLAESASATCLARFASAWRNSRKYLPSASVSNHRQPIPQLHPRMSVERLRD